MRNIRLEGTFTLMSPLQHTGESIGTDSYLSEVPIITPAGDVESVFCYSGNAWRGQLRDAAARYMLDRLSIGPIPLPAFHLLFSGGSIGGQQTVDIDQARRFRRWLPIISLWGGGVGNQLLPGKWCVGDSWPICEETAHLVPERFREGRLQPYTALTYEQSFSRHDDSKDERLRDVHLAPDEEQPQLLIDAPKAKGKKDKSDGPATQMRYTIEMMIPGARLYTRLDLKDVTDLELGCLVSALDMFARAPYIGGGSNRGHGLVQLTYVWQDRESGESGHFLSVGGDQVLLSEPAQEAKDAYDEFLRQAYAAHLDSHESEIKGVLEAVK